LSELQTIENLSFVSQTSSVHPLTSFDWWWTWADCGAEFSADGIRLLWLQWSEFFAEVFLITQTIA
jgi:hypothetical protein